MRLSKQGKCFLMEHCDKNDNNDDCVSLKCNTLSDLEFEAKHFEGVVVLTIDEAQEISNQLYSLALLYSTLILELDPDRSLSNRLSKSYYPLNKKIVKARKSMRISQAEKEHEAK